ncbi:hypothetical protein DVH24_025333 [Malus domestica]|uniref:Pentatricopeptide repeat-containing protein n=1 Tax=Malus domestica TaxID=3750 RepID=A0A498HPJ6_MALDO|nr:hypothetical protein DVH24_025333 [Malus domestica]
MGMEPNVYAYNILLKAMCKNGWCSQRVYFNDGVCKECKIIRRLLLVEMGISGNVIIYSKINNTINDTRNVESALAVLAQMFVRGCSPNVHTYAFLIKGCFVEG